MIRRSPRDAPQRFRMLENTGDAFAWCRQYCVFFAICKYYSTRCKKENKSENFDALPRANVGKCKFQFNYGPYGFYLIYHK